MTRAERVDRYREKKARRTDGGAVRYIARQQNAHRCGTVTHGSGDQLASPATWLHSTQHPAVMHVTKNSCCCCTKS